MREDQDLPEDVISALLGLLNTDGKDDTDFERGLAELCASHPRQAESIRRSAEEARRGLTRPGAGAAGPIAAGAPAPGSIRDARTGTRIGAFHLLERLGEGGMGTVYLAEQRIPVRRRVALKIIKLGMDTSSVLARFEAERQALAMMNHSNIAKVFEAGATDDGKPFFAMEYVQGFPSRVTATGTRSRSKRAWRCSAKSAAACSTRTPRA